MSLPLTSQSRKLCRSSLHDGFYFVLFSVALGGGPAEAKRRRESERSIGGGVFPRRAERPAPTSRARGLLFVVPALFFFWMTTNNGKNRTSLVY